MNSTTILAPYATVPRGPLTILKNHWTGVEKLPVSFSISAIEYLREVQKKLEIAAKYASSHSKLEQEHYKNIII